MAFNHTKFYFSFLLLIYLSFNSLLIIQAEEIDQAGSSQPASPAATNIPATPAPIKEDSSSYIYDLKKLINKSKVNIKRVNEKIKEQAVINRNQKREERARDYYEQAMKLLDNGKLAEARALFDKSIKITEHPEMKDYIKESEKRFKLQEVAVENEQKEVQRKSNEEEHLKILEVEDVYQSAVSLYKQKKFREAKADFERVEELHPDYKATQSYIKVVDQDLVATEARDAIVQQKEIARQQDDAEEARIREKELWRKEIERKERERKEQLKKQADEVYIQAVKLYEKRQYVEAKEKFQEVEWVVPEFKATRKYLERIDKDIADEQIHQAEQKEKELEEQRWQQEVDRKKEEIERQKQLAHKDVVEQKRIEGEAEFHYKAALDLMRKELYDDSLNRFAEAEKFIPGYKSSALYKDRIQDLKSRQEIKVNQEKRREEIRERWKQRLEEQSSGKKELQATLNEVERAYQSAKKLYKQQQWALAREKFLDVESRNPSYKDSSEFIQRIDKQLKSTDATQSQSGEIDNLYQQAIALYKAEDFKGAELKFEDVENINRDYKSTKHYLKNIEAYLKEKESLQQKDGNTQEVKTLFNEAMHSFKQEDYKIAEEKFNAVLSINPQDKSSRKYLEKIDAIRLKNKTQKTSSSKPSTQVDQVTIDMVLPIYNEAFTLYQSKEYDFARSKFEEVEKNVADFKSTRFYLKRIDNQMEREQRWKVQKEQLAQSEEIKVLSSQAKSLYQQIIQLANDRYTSTTKKKFSQIDRILDELTRQQQELMNQVRREEELARQEELKEKQFALKKEKMIQDNALKEKIDPLYEEAVMLYKNKNYEQAKLKFLEITSTSTSYKSTLVYLEKIKRYSEGQKINEEKQKLLEEKMQLEAKNNEFKEKVSEDDAKIQQIVAQANIINDEVIALLKKRDFSGIKERFEQLEKLIWDLRQIKDQIAQREREKQAAQKQQQAELKEKKDKQKILSTKKNKIRQTSSMIFSDTVQEIADGPLKAETQSDLKTQQRRLYKEGMQLYKDRYYNEAKARFSQILTGGPHAQAQAMLTRIDQVKEKEREHQAVRQITQRKMNQKEQNIQRKKLDVMQTKERKVQLKLLSQLEKNRKREEKLRFKEMKKYDRIRNYSDYRPKAKHKGKKRRHSMYVDSLQLRTPASNAPAQEVSAQQDAEVAENNQTLTPQEQKRQERLKQKELIRQEKEKARAEIIERRKKALEEKLKKKEEEAKVQDGQDQTQISQENQEQSIQQEQLTPAEQKQQDRMKKREMIRQEKEKARQEAKERRKKALEEKMKKTEEAEAHEEKTQQIIQTENKEEAAPEQLTPQEQKQQDRLKQREMIRQEKEKVRAQALERRQKLLEEKLRKKEEAAKARADKNQQVETLEENQEQIVQSEQEKDGISEELTTAELKRQKSLKQKELIRQEKEKAKAQALEHRQRILQDKIKKMEEEAQLIEEQKKMVQLPLAETTKDQAVAMKSENQPQIVTPEEIQKQKEEKLKIKEQLRQERIQKKQELIAKKKQEIEEKRKKIEEEKERVRQEREKVEQDKKAQEEALSQKRAQELEELSKQKQKEFEEAERIKQEALEREKQLFQMSQEEKLKKQQELERLAQEKIEREKKDKEFRLQQIEEQKRAREEEILRKKQEADLKRIEAEAKRQALEADRRQKLEELAQKKEQERLENEKLRQKLLEEAKLKMEQEKQARLEAQQRLQLQKEERERALLLEKEQRERQVRLAQEQFKVQKELEAGVEEIYQEALRQFEIGNYDTAASRFKDVADILPDYKKTQSFLEQSNLKLIEK